MEYRHAPAPWRRELNSRGQWEVFNDTGPLVCRLAKWTAAIDDADSRLIAAAPELLAALKDCCAALGGTRHPDAIPASALAAIAKAEGR